MLQRLLPSNKTAFTRQTSVLLAGFKPAVPVSEQPQTDAFRLCGHWDWLDVNILR